MASSTFLKSARVPLTFDGNGTAVIVCTTPGADLRADTITETFDADGNVVRFAVAYTENTITVSMDNGSQPEGMYAVIHTSRSYSFENEQ